MVTPLNKQFIPRPYKTPSQDIPPGTSPYDEWGQSYWYHTDGVQAHKNKLVAEALFPQLGGESCSTPGSQSGLTTENQPPA